MISLAIVLILIATTTIGIVKAYEESEKRIHLKGIQTSEQVVAEEKVREQWLTDFNRLLNESNNGTNLTK
jgi:hypothetical protein